MCCENARPSHHNGLAPRVCLLNLPWAWSGEGQGTRVPPHRWFECGHPAVQSRPRVLSRSWEITLSAWDVQLQGWFRVPCLQSCKWGPLGWDPALPWSQQPWVSTSRACEQQSFWEFMGGFLDMLAVRMMLPLSHMRSHVARSCLFVFSQSFSHSLACHTIPHHPSESLGLYPYRSIYRGKLKLFFLCSFPWPCLKYAVSKKACAAQFLHRRGEFNSQPHKSN